MPTIHLTTPIKAPPETCFDLSRSVEIHLQSTAHTNEKAVAGRTSGFCEQGDTITWEAIHLGVRQWLTVQITEMNRPHYFVDEMVRGAFKSFRHEYHFEPLEGGTVMKDVFTFKAPLGWLGSFASWLFLESYMKNLLVLRNEVIKLEAEHKLSSGTSPVR